MRDNKLVVTTVRKPFCLDLPKDAENNLKYEIYSFIKLNKLLTEHTIENEIRQLSSKYNHGNDFHEHRKQ